jgi:hypothetical protein
MVAVAQNRYAVERNQVKITNIINRLISLEPTLQNIFSSNYADFARRHKLSARSYRAAQAIMGCQTAVMGGHIQRCPNGHIQRVQYHSCHHRSCPKCQGLNRQRWVEKQFAKLLDCDHFHVIFTLPHQLLPLWSYNRNWMSQLLFDASSQTLLQLLRQSNYLGATPGIVLALHTWGRNLSAHPHMHCLVSGGGADSDGRWREVRKDYLLPLEVLKVVYKGKLLSALWKRLQSGELVIPRGESDSDIAGMLKKIGKKRWNVCIQPRYAYGNGVVRYLSNYVKGGPINNHRLLSMNNGSIRFRYRDHRDGEAKQMTLKSDEFLQRILWHVPEKGQHTVRHYGLYHHRMGEKRRQCRAQLGQVPESSADNLSWQDYLDQLGDKAAGHCPTCDAPLVMGQLIAPRSDRVTISLTERSQSDFVQQTDAVGPKSGVSLERGPPH